jgi:hypothetical protein
MEEEPKKVKVKREATPAQLENLRKAREAKAAKKATLLDIGEPVAVKVEEKDEKVEEVEKEETETPPAPPVKKVVLKKTPLAKKAEATVKRVKKQQAHAPTSREMKAAIQQARRAKEQAEEKQHSFDALVEQKVRAILREKAKAEQLTAQQAAAVVVHEEEDDEEEEEAPAGMIEVTESEDDGDDGDDGDGYVSPPVKPPVKPPKRVSNHVQFQPDQQQPAPPPWMTSVYARDPYMMKMAQRLGYS